MTSWPPSSANAAEKMDEPTKSQHTIALVFAVRNDDSLTIDTEVLHRRRDGAARACALLLRVRREAVRRRQHDPAERADRGRFGRRRQPEHDRAEHRDDQDREREERGEQYLKTSSRSQLQNSVEHDERRSADREHDPVPGRHREPLGAPPASRPLSPPRSPPAASPPRPSARSAARRRRAFLRLLGRGLRESRSALRRRLTDEAGRLLLDVGARSAPPAWTSPAVLASITGRSPTPSVRPSAATMTSAGSRLTKNWPTTPCGRTPAAPPRARDEAGHRVAPRGSRAIARAAAAAPRARSPAAAA